ncbi:MAG: hypothetical protein JO126_05430 [Alphaproteobacteria bacterium]|nr:hypothetical protein [Alphaproteobacteria bacterium]
MARGAAGGWPCVVFADAIPGAGKDATPYHLLHDRLAICRAKGDTGPGFVYCLMVYVSFATHMVAA